MSIGRPPKKEEEPGWESAMTMEEWAIAMLRQGHHEIVKQVLKTLPEERKTYYRQLWKREVIDKNKG